MARESGVVGARGHREIQLRSLRGAATGLIGSTCTGVQITPVLMHVREDDSRVVLERIEHTIAVVRIDVDVSDAFQPRFLAQQLDSHTAIVENAKPAARSRAA